VIPALGAVDLALLALQLALGVAAADAGRRVVARFWPELGGSERLVARALIGLLIPVLLVELLGFAGWLTAGGVVAATVVAWLAARALGAPLSTAAPLDPPNPDPWVRLPGLVAALVFAPIAVRALLSVPTDWDGLSYHLLYPARWLQEGRILPSELGAPHDQATLYPAAGEALHTFAMAIVRSDLLVAPLMVACAMLFGIAVAALARTAGAARPAAATAGALAATLPALASRAASSYVEPLLDFALVAALLFARRALVEPGRAVAFASLAGFAAGLAAGTKYVGLPLAAALAVGLPLALALARLPGRRVAAAAGGFTGAAAVAGGAWYLRNSLLTGNPFFPVPVFDLPHLARPGLDWEAGSIWSRWRDLAANGELGELLFALPPGAAPAMTLGPLAGVGLLGALVVLVTAAARAPRRRGAASGPLAAPLVLPLGLLVMIVTYLRLPWWDNPGLLRSLVRFAVPAAALAFALVAAGARREAAARALAGLGAAGVLLQGHLAGVLPAATPLARGLPVVALPAGAALALALLVRRARGRRAWLAACAAGGAATFALFLAWVFREADRPRRQLDPKLPAAAFAAAALAGEQVHPGPATLVWASSGHHEFLALFTGRRLERRVVGLRRHPAELPGWRRPAGDGSIVPVDPAFWRAELAKAGADLLVVSRWGAAGGLWPIEEHWAVAAGWPRRVDQRDFRVYRVPSAADGEAPGSSGGPQPASHPRAP
jgi:hypothetical protein